MDRMIRNLSFEKVIFIIEMVYVSWFQMCYSSKSTQLIYVY